MRANFNSGKTPLSSARPMMLAPRHPERLGSDRLMKRDSARTRSPQFQIVVCQRHPKHIPRQRRHACRAGLWAQAAPRLAHPAPASPHRSRIRRFSMTYLREFSTRLRRNRLHNGETLDPQRPRSKGAHGCLILHQKHNLFALCWL